MEINFNHLILV